MNTKCPHCDQEYDATHRMTGDRVYHLCGKWFLIIHRDGATELTRCEPPATWPKERRKKDAR